MLKIIIKKGEVMNLRSGWETGVIRGRRERKRMRQYSMHICILYSHIKFSKEMKGKEAENRNKGARVSSDRLCTTGITGEVVICPLT